MKKHVLVFALSGFFLNSYAQEMWGISNSNYSGSLGLALNPSTIVGAPYKYDINIFTMDIFVQNNLAFIPASDKLVPRALSGSSDAPTVVVDDYTDNKKSAFVHAQVFGPSFVWSADKKSSWAFHTDFRIEGGVLKVPFALNNFGTLNNSSSSGGAQDYSVPHFSTAMMSWAEAGVTYGKMAANHEKDYLKWAVTLNFLEGLEGMYANVKNLNYTTTDSTLVVRNADATFAHSISSDVLSSRGWGLGTTIGLTYIHDRSERAFSLKRAADGLQKYQYRLGFSLMDIGMVRFNNDAEVVNLNSAGFPSSNLNNLQFDSFQHFDTASVNRIGGSANNKPFNIWLPMAASLQFDYALTPHWYANASIVNRIHFMGNEIARGNQAVTALRYERRNFEVAINLNLFEYSSLSTGFCLRYKWFIIGSDRISQIVSLSNFNAIDLYFGFKINFTDLPKKTKHVHSCPAYKAN